MALAAKPLFFLNYSDFSIFYIISNMIIIFTNKSILNDYIYYSIICIFEIKLTDKPVFIINYWRVDR